MLPAIDALAMAARRAPCAWRSCHFSYRRRSYSRSLLVDTHTLLASSCGAAGRPPAALHVGDPGQSRQALATGHQRHRRATSQSGHAGRATVRPMQVVTVVSAVFGATVLRPRRRRRVVRRHRRRGRGRRRRPGARRGAGAASGARCWPRTATSTTRGTPAGCPTRSACPCVLHAADVYRLADPFGTLGLLGSAAVRRTTRPDRSRRRWPRRGSTPPATWRRGASSRSGPSTTPARPTRCSTLGEPARSSPGTRRGTRRGRRSTCSTAAGAFTGDVLFAGSIGRTDLPGGHDATMQRRCARSSRPCRPATVVVPGHGPTSDIATELVHNPYLARL